MLPQFSAGKPKDCKFQLKREKNSNTEMKKTYSTCLLHENINLLFYILSNIILTFHKWLVVNISLT